MTGDEFAQLLNDFTLSAESGDGARFAGHFTEDAIYYDYIYGPHKGRADIAHMMQNLFHRDAADYRWEMFDPVFDGDNGICVVAVELHLENPAIRRASRVVIDGMSRFILRDGLIAEYRESVNGGVAMAQLGVEPDRMTKVFKRWTGWLKERPETMDYLARPKGSRAQEMRLKACNQQARCRNNDGQHREIAVTYQHILYDVSEKIATITLNRPDRMNAWTPVMERDVRHAMEAAAADDNVRVIVLTGAGRAFCAGADMDALKGLDPDDIRRAESLPPFDMNRRPDWQARYAYYPSIPKPVIGMLNGATAGIGLVHALYCDLRFAADNTVFTTAFSRRGLIAEHGISWMLPRIVGHANALDLLMSARRVSSDEALRIGLVNRLYPPEQLREETYAYARDLADFVSPSAIAVIKRQLYDVPFQTLAEATIDANREMVVALRGSDFREGVASFVEKRPPRFTGK